MIVNISYDASVNNAPAAFEPAVQAAVQFLENNFSTPITITLHVGYGEINSQPMSSGDLGESEEDPSVYSYSQIRNALASHATSVADRSAVASLPLTSPINGTFGVAAAEAAALGLLPHGVPITGWVGFGTGAPFDYDDSNGVSAGQYDFFGVVVHEITEVLGRDAGLAANSSGTYSILDLFRYSSQGIRNFVGTQPGYFSINGGVTHLANFNTDTNGDFGDWAGSAGNDSFLAFSPSGVINSVTQTDLTLMDILGFDQVILPVTVMSVATSPASGNVAADRAVTITLDVSGPATVAGGTPTLTLNDGGTATYDSGRSSAQALVFDYTVGATDRTSNLAIVAVNDPAGTTIADSIGRAADLSAAISGLGTGLQVGTITNGTVAGGSGNDVFYALATSLAFNGGGGHDTLVLDGARSLYNIAESGGGVTITDSIANHDGSHVLTDIEDLRFTDKIVFVENSDNANLARLYAATFARAPDVGGLNYWEDIYATVPASAKTSAMVGLAQTIPTGMTASIAASFIASTEFQQDYGLNPTDMNFLTHLYQNALGRAPDPVGESYWLNYLQSGETAGNTAIKGMVLVGFAESTENIGRTAADWLFAT